LVVRDLHVRLDSQEEKKRLGRPTKEALEALYQSTGFALWLPHSPPPSRSMRAGKGPSRFLVNEHIVVVLFFTFRIRIPVISCARHVCREGSRKRDKGRRWLRPHAHHATSHSHAHRSRHRHRGAHRPRRLHRCRHVAHPIRRRRSPTGEVRMRGRRTRHRVDWGPIRGEHSRTGRATTAAERRSGRNGARGNERTRRGRGLRQGRTRLVRPSVRRIRGPAEVSHRCVRR
jgi:hypothetical protein